jgi:hypothetical protein
MIFGFASAFSLSLIWKVTIFPDGLIIPTPIISSLNSNLHSQRINAQPL